MAMRDSYRVARRTTQAALLVAFAAFLGWPEEQLPGEALFDVDLLTLGTGALAARTALLVLAGTAALLLVTFFLGRVFCGFVCPLGTIVDAVDFVTGLRARGRRLKRVKRHVAIVLVALAAFGVTAAWLLDPINWAARLGALLSRATIDWCVAAVLIGALLGVAIAAGRRGFCRVLCPLGALLGWIASISPFARSVSSTCIDCGRCSATCRMAAIGDDPRDFDRAECIHCGDCETDCPAAAIEYRYLESVTPARVDLPRREYLLSLAGGVGLGLLLRGQDRAPIARAAIRPPGAVGEDALADLCIRCGECVQACPTGGLRHAATEVDPLLFQTPVLSGRDGGCAYGCNACGRACPTGAIEELPLEVKQREKLGVAEVEFGRCVPASRKQPCLVCYAACPVFAIELAPIGRVKGRGDRLMVPWIREDVCTGCGLCEARCPVAGEAAIRIKPIQSTHS
jgi:MauM/NapG family ferredoxin protein